MWLHSGLARDRGWGGAVVVAAVAVAAVADLGRSSRATSRAGRRVSSSRGTAVTRTIKANANARDGMKVLPSSGAPELAC